MGFFVFHDVFESGVADGVVAEDFSVRATDGSGGWVLSGTVGQDAFKTEIDKDDNGSYELTLTKTDQDLFTNVALGGAKNIGLKYSAPSSDTKGGGVAQDFTVILTASRYTP